VALLVFGLWVTGIYLFFLPYAVRWSRRGRKSASEASPGAAPSQ
jgi:hypothetical protein